MNTNNLGLHLTLDLSKCNTEKLTNIGLIYDFLLDLPKAINMQTITLPYVVKWLDKGTKIEGISGFSMIAESHISIHTYPERKHIYADVFSCKGFHVKKVLSLFLKTFEAMKYEKRVIKRGFIDSNI